MSDTEQPAPNPTRTPRKKAAAKAAAKPAKVFVRANQFNKYHPYAKITITGAAPVEVPLDNWTEIQLEAGVLVKS